MPFALRYRMAYDHRLVREVRRVMMRTIFAFLRRRARARGLAEPEGGAVAFVQRFGSALNLNPHLHVLVLDGVYARPAPDGPRLFHRLPDPTEAEISTLLSALRARLSRRLRRLGIPPLDDETAAEAPLPFASESLGATYAAAVQDRDASGA
ncbi:MAG: transposase, partial [Kiritimatiellae bacterium]|nr:transposase [Kiritimatiellia bacterium]